MFPGFLLKKEVAAWMLSSRCGFSEDKPLRRRFWKGLLAVWVGGALGQAGAFLLARYLVRDWVSDYVARKWSKARWPPLPTAMSRSHPPAAICMTGTNA